MNLRSRGSTSIASTYTNVTDYKYFYPRDAIEQNVAASEDYLCLPWLRVDSTSIEALQPLDLENFLQIQVQYR